MVVALCEWLAVSMICLGVFLLFIFLLGLLDLGIFDGKFAKMFKHLANDWFDRTFGGGA